MALPLSTSQTLKEFKDLKQGIRMGHVVMNHGLAYGRLA